MGADVLESRRGCPSRVSAEKGSVLRRGPAGVGGRVVWWVQRGVEAGGLSGRGVSREKRLSRDFAGFGGVLAVAGGFAAGVVVVGPVEGVVGVSSSSAEVRGRSLAQSTRIPAATGGKAGAEGSVDAGVCSCGVVAREKKFVQDAVRCGGVSGVGGVDAGVLSFGGGAREKRLIRERVRLGGV